MKKKNLKKAVRFLLSLVLSLSMVFSLTPIKTLADETTSKETQTNETEIKEPEVLTGEFEYGATKPSDTTIYKSTYYYSDGYFLESSTTKNAHRRTISASLSFTTAQSPSKNGKLTKELLEKIGFTDIVTADMNVATVDSLGTVIAHKKVNDYDLIAVVIRGSDYGREMINNIKMGKTGDSQGISESAKKLMTRISKYISDYSLTTANKIWISGYSRGGGVADLAGQYMNNDLESYYTTFDDFYVYTFEAVSASLKYTAYKNIHNVLSNDDPIPIVMPQQYNFITSGVKEVISSPTTKVTTRYLSSSNLSSLLINYGLSNDVIVENGEKYAYDAVSDFFVFLINNGLTREIYSSSLEEEVGYFLDLYYSTSSSQETKIKNFIKSRLLDEVKNDAGPLVQKLQTLNSKSSSSEYKSFIDLLFTYIERAKANCNEGEFPYTDEKYAEIKEHAYSALTILLPLAFKDLDNSKPLVNILTFVTNVDTLFVGHYTETLLPLIQDKDTNYNIFARDESITPAPAKVTEEPSKTVETTSPSVETITPVTSEVPTDDAINEETPEPKDEIDIGPSGNDPIGPVSEDEEPTPISSEVPTTQAPADDVNPNALKANSTPQPITVTATEAPNTASQIAPMIATTFKSVTNKKAGICLKWYPIAAAASYKVMKLENDTWTEIATLDSSKNSYTDESTKSENGTSYQYKITTISNGYGDASSEPVTALRLTGIKLKSAKKSGDNNVNLSWKKNSEADGYQVKYTNGSKTKKIMVKNKKDLSLTISKLDFSKKSTFKVRVYKDNNDITYYSQWSAKKVIKPDK